MSQLKIDFSPELSARLRRVRKVDLHRHLSGSVRSSTLLDLMRGGNLDIPARGAEELQAILTLRSPVTSLRTFITPRKSVRPWTLLHQLVTSREIVIRLVREAFEDAAEDGVVYLELRVSPYGLGEGYAIPFEEFLAGLKVGVTKAREDLGIDGGISLSLIRHNLVRLSSEQRADYYARLLEGAKHFQGDPIVGFDLAGIEREAPPALFSDFFQQAKGLGFGITIHAGEGEPASNILDAINLLGADRIGHGVTLVEAPHLMTLVRDKGVLIEQCITSNLSTRAVADIRSHPLSRLLQAGIQVALCSDDPTLLDISLTEEYCTACLDLGLREEQLHEMNAWAMTARFNQSQCSAPQILDREANQV